MERSRFLLWAWFYSIIKAMCIAAHSISAWTFARLAVGFPAEMAAVGVYSAMAAGTKAALWGREVVAWKVLEVTSAHAVFWIAKTRGRERWMWLVGLATVVVWSIAMVIEVGMEDYLERRGLFKETIEAALMVIVEITVILDILDWIYVFRCWFIYCLI